MTEVRLTMMVRRKPGMTREQFRDAYENWPTHSGLRIFGHLWKGYKRQYIDGGAPFTAQERDPAEAADIVDDPPFDCISEITFHDMAAFEESNRLAAIPENRRMVREEEDQLYDRANCWTIVTTNVEYDPPVDSAAMGNIHTAHLKKDE